MRYTLEQAQTDESLPYWWTEKGCPDWARDDDYRDVPPDLAFEVRYGMTEARLRERLKQRRADAERRRKRDAERAAETHEQRAHRERCESGVKRLAKLKGSVTMWRNRVTTAEQAEIASFQSLSLPSYRMHLASAEAALSDYLTSALRDALADPSA
jgi:hypothetical protein